MIQFLPLAIGGVIFIYGLKVFEKDVPIDPPKPEKKTKSKPKKGKTIVTYVCKNEINNLGKFDTKKEAVAFAEKYRDKVGEPVTVEIVHINDKTGKEKVAETLEFTAPEPETEEVEDDAEESEDDDTEETEAEEGDEDKEGA